MALFFFGSMSIHKITIHFSRGALTTAYDYMPAFPGSVHQYAPKSIISCLYGNDILLSFFISAKFSDIALKNEAALSFSSQCAKLRLLTHAKFFFENMV